MAHVVKEPLLTVDERLNFLGHVVEDHGELCDVGVVLLEFLRDAGLEFAPREGPHGVVEFFERPREAPCQIPAHENDEKKRAGEREAERKMGQMPRQGGRLLHADGKEQIIAPRRFDAPHGAFGLFARRVGLEHFAKLLQGGGGDFTIQNVLQGFVRDVESRLEEIGTSLAQPVRRGLGAAVAKNRGEGAERALRGGTVAQFADAASHGALDEVGDRHHHTGRDDEDGGEAQEKLAEKTSSRSPRKHFQSPSSMLSTN